MGTDNKDQKVDQLLRGIYRLCVTKDECSACPFYVTKCVFGEPKPGTWFDEETIELPKPPIREPVVRESFIHLPEDKPKEEEKKEEKEKEKEDDSKGTWLVSTTMGSVFSKYVYICSKCGYKKESVLSITPMAYCPECEKKKANKDS